MILDDREMVFFDEERLVFLAASIFLVSFVNVSMKMKSAVIKNQGESECLFPEDLRSRERTHLVFGAHFGAERGHKTIGNSMSDCIKQ